MQLEKWKKFPLNKSYEVSTFGNVRSVERVIKYSDGRVMKWSGRMMRKQLWTNGYQFVATCQNGQPKQYSVHRMVAITHIKNPNSLPNVNHKDGIKINNHVDNLEWCTTAYNNLHAYRTGIKKHHRCWLGKSGYSHNKSKEIVQYDENWIEIKRYGSGRECMRENGIRNIWYYVTKQKPFNGKIYAYV